MKTLVLIAVMLCADPPATEVVATETALREVAAEVVGPVVELVEAEDPFAYRGERGSDRYFKWHIIHFHDFGIDLETVVYTEAVWREVRKEKHASE